jgi:hypothetical protein
VSFHELLLESTEPLEPHERAALEDWMRVLMDDCVVFGTTAEDAARIRAIRQRLALDKATAKPSQHTGGE